MKKIMILDGHSLIFRAYHAIPELVTSNGTVTNAIYGFVTMLMKIIEEYSPNAVFVAFDMHAPTFRHKMYSEYKAGRSATPEQLLTQIDTMKKLLVEFGITVLEREGFEADDILGTLSAQASARGIKSYIVTGDRDSLQLINENTTVLYTKKGVSNIVEFDEAEFINEYGIKPVQFVDCKALMGDSSDNIPGVAGVGQKTAVSLLQAYGTLDGIYENLDSVKSQSVKTKLESSKESAYMSRTLARIVTDAPVELTEIPDEIYSVKPTDSLCTMLKELELNKILASIKTEANETQTEKNVGCIDIYEIGIEKVFDDIKSCSSVSVFGDGVDGIVSGGCVLWTDNSVYSSAKSYREICSDFKAVFEDDTIKKYLQDIKQTMHICAELGFELKNAAFDYSVTAYLLDAVNWRRDIDYMASKYISPLWQEDMTALASLRKNMEKRLEEQGMLSLYYDIEHPLIEVLYSMEREGFTVDTDMLERLGEEYEVRLSKIRDKIYEFAEGEFNINSTKQLADVLFVKLQLPTVKKTKTGFSTDNEVLEQIRGTHEIVELIINYRQLSKLKSTYVDGLIASADENSKVHTTFNQTVTNTGRLSSTDPNLQNIPVRTEEGSQIRRAFVAGDEDYVIADADYSQIELRMFAHMSGDAKFIDAFKAGEDIHRKTASDVFGVPYEEVSDSYRSQAKAVNFGIIYGISDFGLARNLSIPKAEAKKIISDYFVHFPTIEEYMKRSIEFARENEYCKTIFGRRRICTDIHSRNFAVRTAAERIAINMPVQGSAADIIKVAMLNVYRELKKNNLRSKLILQVHDELLVKTHKDELEAVKTILKDCMENAVKLDVPLVADIGSGDNWAEAK